MRRVRVIGASVATISVFVLSCRGRPAMPTGTSGASTRADVVVIAPHPDDETLIAAGVLARAVRAGQSLAVVVVTNGDFTCERDGYAREVETVRAMEIVGVPESAVTFLGYPDGYLAELGPDPLPPIPRRMPDGSCGRATGTYAVRGREHRDEHKARTGAAAPYTSDALEGDLAAVLTRLAPRDIYVTHGIDRHPDHAATYAYVRRALEALPAEAALPVIHRAVVHAGACWPNGRETHEPCPAETFAPGENLPALPDPLGAYAPRERVAVPADMAARAPAENTKMRAIAAYATQTGPDAVHDWLASFARAEETFYPEVLVRDGAQLVRSGPSELGAARAARYSLRVADDGAKAELLRDAEVIRRWDLPLGPTRALPHTFTLRVDARADDGPVVEVSVRRDGRFMGLAVDAAVP